MTNMLTEVTVTIQVSKFELESLKDVIETADPGEEVDPLVTTIMDTAYGVHQKLRAAYERSH